MNPVRDRGFTLIELSFVILFMGILFAASIPAYNSFRKTQDLKGATSNVASQLRLAREKAIATGEPQIMHFTYQWSGCDYCDYHIHNSAVGAKWTLPKGVSYLWSSGTISSLQMNKSGHTTAPGSSNPLSGMIILQNQRGLRDTVIVQASGLVLN